MAKNRDDHQFHVRSNPVDPTPGRTTIPWRRRSRSDRSAASLQPREPTLATRIASVERGAGAAQGAARPAWRATSAGTYRRRPRNEGPDLTHPGSRLRDAIAGTVETRIREPTGGGAGMVSERRGYRGGATAFSVQEMLRQRRRGPNKVQRQPHQRRRRMVLARRRDVAADSRRHHSLGQTRAERAADAVRLFGKGNVLLPRRWRDLITPEVRAPPCPEDHTLRARLPAPRESREPGILKAELPRWADDGSFHPSGAARRPAGPS